MTILKIDNLSLINSNKLILSNINFSVEKGDFITIIGPSGSGKSTLLKIISSLKDASEGRILFNNEPYSFYSPTELRKEISYCFQMPYLFGNTVMDDLTFPFKIRGIDIDYEQINYYLDNFELSNDLLDENPINLSGGEKQRISLIRSILFPPKILLLDEVTSSLDNYNTLIVEKNIINLNNQGVTILWVTHDIDQSLKIGNKRLTINNGFLEKFEELNHGN
ncbi:MAG: ATP-binding cassette domain-containing protein [Clostridiaceae bacterium]